MGWILVLIVLIVLLVAAANFCYRLVFYNANLQPQDPYVIPPGPQYARVGDVLLQAVAKWDALEFERVQIRAQDGVQLVGRYYHVADGAPLQIQFHGYRSCVLRDLCGSAMLAKELGCNVLLVDQRAHGESGGHCITFGIRERYDCLEWVRYAQTRFGSDTKIVLMGLSMGAATVLMASELLTEGAVKGIIADCPYSAPGAIIRSVCRMARLPSFLLYPLVMLGAWLFGGFRLWEASAQKAVSKSSVPILLLHGEADQLVPCDMSRQLQRANTQMVALVTFPEAGHGLSYAISPEKYRQIVTAFLRDCGIPVP